MNNNFSRFKKMLSESHKEFIDQSHGFPSTIRGRKQYPLAILSHVDAHDLEKIKHFPWFIAVGSEKDKHNAGYPEKEYTVIFYTEDHGNAIGDLAHMGYR